MLFFICVASPMSDFYCSDNKMSFTVDFDFEVVNSDYLEMTLLDFKAARSVHLSCSRGWAYEHNLLPCWICNDFFFPLNQLYIYTKCFITQLGSSRLVWFYLSCVWESKKCFLLITQINQSCSALFWLASTLFHCQKKDTCRPRVLTSSCSWAVWMFESHDFASTSQKRGYTQFMLTQHGTCFL